MEKIFTASMPIKQSHDEMLKLSVYGFAFNTYVKELSKKYALIDVTETFIDSDKSETRTLNVKLILMERNAIN